MATVSEIITNVRSNLEDDSSIYYSDQNILDVIQLGYSRFAVLTGYITKAKYFPIQNQPYWYLRNFIPDYLYLKGIFDNQRHKWFTSTDLRYLREIRDDWELWIGSTEFVVSMDFNRVAVAPHLSSVVGQCIIYYSAFAEQLITSSVPQVPPCCTQILEWYTTARLFGHLKEFTKASEYWKKWQIGISQTINYIDNLGNTDKVRVMSPYLQMERYSQGAPMAGFIDDEIPTGTINGVNTTFTLVSVPSPTDSLCLYKNGQLLFEGIGYTLTGSTIVYASGYIPDTGDVHRAWYRVA
jgi:hypothetical protein